MANNEYHWFDMKSIIVQNITKHYVWIGSSQNNRFKVPTQPTELCVEEEK